MPYQGKEARERLRWMTPAEAVDHVVLTEHCERVVALSEIRLALGEGDIPGRWAASPLPAVIPSDFRRFFLPTTFEPITSIGAKY